MTKFSLSAIRRAVSGPAMASGLLVLYGVALVTHAVAGITIV